MDDSALAARGSEVEREGCVAMEPNNGLYVRAKKLTQQQAQIQTNVQI